LEGSSTTATFVCSLSVTRLDYLLLSAYPVACNMLG
jgi:hypothetical protein